jgi:hypothetical protein
MSLLLNRNRLSIPVRFLWPALTLSILILGCGAENEKNVMTDPATGSGKVAHYLVSPADAPSGAMAPAAANPKAAAIVDRKILYSADLSMVTANFTKLESAIVKLVRENDGYIADADVGGTVGLNRHARWKIRIPVEKFDSFLTSASGLGELSQRQIHSQDVTEEFYDLESRIKNKKVEETRLLKHLTDSTGKLDEILAAEKELSRVREEVERQEGRLRLLANLASLTTVTITASESSTFVPATAPTFATRASRTFEASYKGLVEFTQGFALFVIGLLPWIPVILILALIAFLMVRRTYRRSLARPIPQDRF